MNQDLASYLVRILLRYFRGGEAQTVSQPSLRQDDLDMLVLQWSCSREVRDVCEHLALHPHELHASLRTRTVAGSGVVRGRIRAAESVLHQVRTADPTAFIFDEPFRSYESGPNRVLVWTLTYALRLAQRFRTLQTDKSGYLSRTDAALQDIEGVRRLLPFAGSSLSQPRPGDVLAARSSKQLLYRKAAEAYDFLRSVERLDAGALDGLLRDALIGPLESQQFEMALALAMATAISNRIGKNLILNTIVPGAGDYLIKVGPYVIRWQRPGPLYEQPALDKWEIRAVEILTEFRVSAGYDRPDVIVYDSRNGDVLAVGEAKFFGHDRWKDPLRDAVRQVVSYARGYETQQDVNDLIGRSLVALWSINEQTPRPTSTTSPWVTTFAEMNEGLEAWAARAIP